MARGWIRMACCQSEVPIPVDVPDRDCHRTTRTDIYAGSQHVHVSDDAGQTWKVISPDLTTNDK